MYEILNDCRQRLKRYSTADDDVSATETQYENTAG